MKSTVLLEICVDSVQSAVAAEEGGARRVELCCNLPSGGLTPSAGLIAMVRQRVPIALHVMIRPRPGDFCYDPDEFAAMKRDVLMARELGADGVVFGILMESGQIDSERTRCLVEMARPLSTTFHRAFDMCIDIDKALELLVATGVDRILTSGSASRAEDGAATIAHLVSVAQNRITIMAGGGIRENNVARVIAATGIRELHANLAFPAPRPPQLPHQEILLRAIQRCDSPPMVVTKESVRRLLEATSI